MVRITLTDTDNNRVLVDEGESADVTVSLIDTGGVTLVKSALATLTATLIHVASDSTVTTINSRNAQSVLDANDGTVATNGTLTLRLQPADNIMVGTVSPDETESHYLTIAWTWNDGTAVRTGKQEFEILVREVAAP